MINDSDEIPQDKLAHLFDRFYRMDEARTSKGQHYGLGLSIAKAVTEKNDGSISVSCQNGKIRFIVSIPIKKKDSSIFLQSTSLTMTLSPAREVSF